MPHQLIPVQVGGPSDYAQSRRGWLIVVLAVQTAAATFSLCTPMLSLAGAVNFTDVSGGVVLAVAVFFGCCGWLENMNISYIFLWLWLCFTYVIYASAAGAYSFSHKYEPETLPATELAARLSSLVAAVFGLSLGWLLYDDYQAEHPGQDALGHFLRRFGVFGAAAGELRGEQLPILQQQKCSARRSWDPPPKRPGDDDDQVSPFRALFTWDPPERPATVQEPWPLPDNQASDRSSTVFSSDVRSSTVQHSRPAATRAAASAGPVGVPGLAPVTSATVGFAAFPAGPVESRSDTTLTSSPDVTSRTVSTTGHLPNSSRFASARPAFPAPTPRTPAGGSLTSARPASSSRRPYERYDL